MRVRFDFRQLSPASASLRASGRRRFDPECWRNERWRLSAILTCRGIDAGARFALRSFATLDVERVVKVDVSSVTKAATRPAPGRQFIERAGVAPRATLGPATECRFSRRKETRMRSVAFSQQGGAKHRRHQQTIAKAEFVLKRKSHGIVVQLATVAQQPNPREPQKYD